VNIISRLWASRCAKGGFSTERDNDQVPPVCVVNESFAKRLFPGESPLGKILRRGVGAEIKCEIVAWSAM